MVTVGFRVLGCILGFGLLEGSWNLEATCNWAGY